MDELLLTFNDKQYKKYLEIKENEAFELDFDTSLEQVTPSSPDTIKAESTKMVRECEKLLAIKNRQNVFVSAFSRKEIENLIPIFYTAIGKIDQSKRKLYQESILIAKNLEKADRICNDVYNRYSDFLPYKAALADKEEYRDNVIAVDEKFKESIALAEEQINHEKELLAGLSNIVDVIIPDFFKGISRAADTPRFENFDDKLFFFAVASFVEKIKI